VYSQNIIYNPYGKQITQNWYNETVSTPLVKRGYTGHEYIKEYADFGNFNFYSKKDSRHFRTKIFIIGK
jgi:hypothetical protein